MSILRENSPGGLSVRQEVQRSDSAAAALPSRGGEAAAAGSGSGSGSAAPWHSRQVAASAPPALCAASAFFTCAPAAASLRAAEQWGEEGPGWAAGRG